MICELCRKNQANIHIKNERGILDICQECQNDIQDAVSYYIKGNEVVIEEFKERATKRWEK